MSKTFAKVSVSKSSENGHVTHGVIQKKERASYKIFITVTTIFIDARVTYGRKKFDFLVKNEAFQVYSKSHQIAQ